MYKRYAATFNFSYFVWVDGPAHIEKQIPLEMWKKFYDTMTFTSLDKDLINDQRYDLDLYPAIITEAQQLMTEFLDLKTEKFGIKTNGINHCYFRNTETGGY